MNYFDRPDGETFADIPSKQIAPASTWESLSINQLVETQVHLQGRAWDFRNNPAILKALNTSLQNIQAIISKKTLDGS